MEVSLLTSVLYGEWSASRPGRFTPVPTKQENDRHRANVNNMDKKISCPCQEWLHDLSDLQPVAYLTSRATLLSASAVNQTTLLSKTKFTLEQAIKAQRGCDGTALLFL